MTEGFYLYFYSNLLFYVYLILNRNLSITKNHTEILSLLLPTVFTFRTILKNKIPLAYYMYAKNGIF